MQILLQDQIMHTTTITYAVITANFLLQTAISKMRNLN